VARSSQFYRDERASEFLLTSNAAYGIGFRQDTLPQLGSCAVTFGYCAENHHGIRQLKENISKNKVFTGYRAVTIIKTSV
jgi:hypothetical protein